MCRSWLPIALNSQTSGPDLWLMTMTMTMGIKMTRMGRVRMKMKKMWMMQMPIIAGQTCPVMHSALPTPDLGKSQLWNGCLTLEALLESIRGKKDTKKISAKNKHS